MRCCNEMTNLTHGAIFFLFYVSAVGGAIIAQAQVFWSNRARRRHCRHVVRHYWSARINFRLLEYAHTTCCSDATKTFARAPIFRKRIFIEYFSYGTFCFCWKVGPIVSHLTRMHSMAMPLYLFHSLKHTHPNQIIENRCAHYEFRCCGWLLLPSRCDPINIWIRRAYLRIYEHGNTTNVANPICLPLNINKLNCWIFIYISFSLARLYDVLCVCVCLAPRRGLLCCRRMLTFTICAKVAAQTIILYLHCVLGVMMRAGGRPRQLYFSLSQHSTYCSVQTIASDSYISARQIVASSLCARLINFLCCSSGANSVCHFVPLPLSILAYVYDCLSHADAIVVAAVDVSMNSIRYLQWNLDLMCRLQIRHFVHSGESKKYNTQSQIDKDRGRWSQIGHGLTWDSAIFSKPYTEWTYASQPNVNRVGGA